ncbi:MAG: oligosaccharide flippase family protein [Hyphomicrobiales bacterium]|nr:oligosaccharide flippase family protein [Hyphomicrobiales bacterium]
MRAQAQSLVKYTLFNAPWTLIASLSSGLSNYIIILVLSGAFGLAAGGQFRLFLSIMGVLSIFTLTDTGKIVVKYLVLGDAGVVRPLLFNRMRWALAGIVAGAVWAAIFYDRGNELWLPVLAGALLLPLTYPTDMYAQINQARKQFSLNALYSVTKYGTLVVLALVATRVGMSVAVFLIAYSIAIASYHIFYLTRHPETFEQANPNARTYIREGIQLSGSGLFPLLMESADKFLISYFFGLEALGLYAIGVSTGRLFLHLVKPTLAIYFPILVTRRPDARLLLVSLIVLTGIGIVAALLMEWYFTYVLAAKYMDAYPLAAVVVAGLGVYAVGVIIQYSSIYYKHSTVIIPAIVNVTTAILVVSYLFVSVLQGGEYALLLCAASYPLRDFLIMTTTTLLSKRVGVHEKTDLVH